MDNPRFRGGSDAKAENLLSSKDGLMQKGLITGCLSSLLKGLLADTGVLAPVGRMVFPVRILWLENQEESYFLL